MASPDSKVAKPMVKVRRAPIAQPAPAGALLAALAGVNAVAGPGMLDFVLTFSLPKLVLDHEFCGQALHFCRPIQPLDDRRPTRPLYTFRPHRATRVPRGIPQ